MESRLYCVAPRVEENLTCVRNQRLIGIMDQGHDRTSIQRFSPKGAAFPGFLVASAGLIGALIFGGCAVVSGLDDFKVVDSDAPSVNGTGTSSTSSGGTADFVSIGGTVSGLLGTGLVLQNNLSDELQIEMDGPFIFPNKLQSASSFEVTTKTQPSSGGPCVVSGGTGVVGNANVTNVSVQCSGPGGNQGILCDNQYCALGTECCSLNGTYTCADKCSGASVNAIKCDSAADCQTGLVCCGVITADVINSIYCSTSAQCTAPKAYFCDPTLADPCPQGGTCTSTTLPPGYYRCF